ncbi:MAG: hypothetical protein KBD60_00770 [Sterolibacterium sp.]|jgi:hypothetical protein|nr:hypothetical protein [Sterolibacterium sp.]
MIRQPFQGYRHSRAGGNPLIACAFAAPWIPACAGMTADVDAPEEGNEWVPACAGMTADVDASEEGNEWIPACVGMT